MCAVLSIAFTQMICQNGKCLPHSWHYFSQSVHFHSPHVKGVEPLLGMWYRPHLSVVSSTAFTQVTCQNWKCLPHSSHLVNQSIFIYNMGHSMSNQQRIYLELSHFLTIIGNDWDPWEWPKMENFCCDMHANEIWANYRYLANYNSHTHISESIAPRQLLRVSFLSFLQAL